MADIYFLKSVNTVYLCLLVSLLRVAMNMCVYLPSSHQVSHTLQRKFWYAAVILITTVPEGQLAKVTNKLVIASCPFFKIF